MPLVHCPSCQGPISFEKGFVEVYECPHCGSDVEIPEHFLLKAKFTSQQLRMQSIVCTIVGILLIFLIMLPMGPVERWGSADWVVFFTICSLPTYIFLGFSIYLFFRSNLVKRGEEAAGY